MNIFHNFLYKLFGFIVMVFFYTGVNCALADSDITNAHNITNDYITTRESYLDIRWGRVTPTQKICSDGYYLSSCNKREVGTNWLKGTTETPDYYSYGSSVSDPIHMTNLRKFFAGIEPIYYKPVDSTEPETVLPSEYVEYRNQILTTFCTKNYKLINTECKKCPNDAKIPESIVKVNKSNGKIVEDSWQVYTIADCYIDEFSDHTGTYIYAPTTAATSSSTAKKCYYSNNVQGDELVSE